jgi:hypothetical protein
LFGALRNFVATGGTAQVFLGVRNGTTSSQAVSHLLSAGVVVYACDTKLSVLFHPKVYLLDGDAIAWVAVGSSNLTREGLFRNYEASTLVRLDLAVARDAEYLNSFDEWFRRIPASIEDCLRIQPPDLPGMVVDGRLVDESVRPAIERLAGPSSGRAGSRGTRAIVIPPAPPPHPDAPVTAVRRRGAGARKESAVRSRSARFFVMTLSAFDCSHRRGTPGTPEISVPETVASFFPSVRHADRAYPDAYFDVLLNGLAGLSGVVSYRIWQRPPGAASGHADWRINVKHETIDLTDPGGNDIILFEKLPIGSQPAYEVWIVHGGDSTYDALLARCRREVQATGTAGRKRFGLF